jgi:hypothetical protein
MADLRPTRTHTSSRTRSRSRSRPSRPALHQLLSTQFPDDHSVYHQDVNEDVLERSDTQPHNRLRPQRTRGSTENDSDSSSGADTSEDGEVAQTESKELKVDEIRDGIPDERDVEAQTPQLEKTKSSRSIKDPNLVSVSPFIE